MPRTLPSWNCGILFNVVGLDRGNLRLLLERDPWPAGVQVCCGGGGPHRISERLAWLGGGGSLQALVCRPHAQLPQPSAGRRHPATAQLRPQVRPALRGEEDCVGGRGLNQSRSGEQSLQPTAEC